MNRATFYSLVFPIILSYVWRNVEPIPGKNTILVLSSQYKTFKMQAFKISSLPISFFQICSARKSVHQPDSKILFQEITTFINISNCRKRGRNVNDVVIGSINIFEILLGQYMALQHCTWNLSGMIWDLGVERFRTSCRKKWDSIEILFNVLNKVPDMVFEDDPQCQHH